MTTATCYDYFDYYDDYFYCHDDDYYCYPWHTSFIERSSGLSPHCDHAIFHCSADHDASNRKREKPAVARFNQTLNHARKPKSAPKPKIGRTKPTNLRTKTINTAPNRL